MTIICFWGIVNQHHPDFTRGVATSELRSHHKVIHGQKYTFVDVPGFTGPDRNESDTVRAISTALCRVHNIRGILYLHRISDDRMLGSSIRHLQIFQALCGTSCMGNVCILTTHWDRVSQELGQARKSELLEHYWKELITGGADVEDFDGSLENADKITKRLRCHGVIKLAIQEQMIKRGEFEETDAGRIVNEEQRLRQRKEEELRLAEEKLARLENSTVLGEPQISREIKILNEMVRGRDEEIEVLKGNVKYLEMQNKTLKQDNKSLTEENTALKSQNQRLNAQSTILEPRSLQTALTTWGTRRHMDKTRLNVRR